MAAILLRTVNGDLAVSDGIVYTLTPCCGASYKGMDAYVGCRACYANREDVPGAGDGCMASDSEYVASLARTLLGDSVPEFMANMMATEAAREAKARVA